MIKNIDERIIAEGFHTGHEVDVVTIQKSDYEHLKEQAERVNELEEEIKTHAPHGRNYTNAEYVELLQENKRYREVIKEALAYANSPKILTNLSGIEKILSKALEGEE